MSRIDEINAKKSAFVVAINQISSPRISKKKMKEQAEELGLHFESAEKAYLNVTDSAIPMLDRRCRRSNPELTVKLQFKQESIEKIKARNKEMYRRPFRDISPAEAAKVIVDVMTSKDRVYAILEKYNLAPNQYYAMLFELEVYGTLRGKKILDYTKFNKYPVVDIIRIKKYPNGNITKNKDFIELSNLHRASSILYNKLVRLAAKASV